MITMNKPPLEEAYLAHISMRPWSEYSSADYTPEQWHRACLIHQHQGAPTSKNQCKLPVRTPNGAINRNGVRAAAAALAGARGGVDASDAEKASARTALVRLYSELDEDPPPGLAKHSDMSEDEYLMHVGIKGMKWGVRKDRSRGSGQKSGTGKKIAKAVGVGLVLVAGAAATAYILRRSSGTRVSELTSSVTSSVKSGVDAAPSPAALRVEAGRAARRNMYNRIANQEFTNKTWRDSAEMTRLARDSSTRMSLSDVRKALNDPNHVWEI